MAALGADTGEAVNLAAVPRWRIVYVSILYGVLNAARPAGAGLDGIPGRFSRCCWRRC
jgi:hypothetical protein